MKPFNRALLFVLFGLLFGVGQGFADVKEGAVWKSVDIGSCEDLVKFAEAANGKTEYKGSLLKYEPLNERNGSDTYNALQTDVNITQPIDMSCSSNFPMIGHEAYHTGNGHANNKQNFRVRYDGTFNGNGFSISNLKIDSKEQNVALIAVLADNGVVKNVVLDNIDYTASGVQVEGTGNPISIGGIVGWQYGGSVIKCYVSGQISTSGLEQRVGGITGYGTEGEIENCLSVVSLYTSSNLSSIGGIVGALSNVVVKNCVYGGDNIQNDGDGYTGGIAGVDVSGSKDSIANCFYDSSKVDRTIGNGKANSKKTGATGVIDVNSDEVVNDLNEENCEATSSCIWSNGKDDITNMGVSNDRANETVFTISFLAGEGCSFPKNAVAYKQLKLGTSITSDNITAPVCEDKKFLGWSLEDDGSVDANLGKVVGATGIYAVWEPYVTITFDANGGKFGDETTTRTKKIEKGVKISAEGIEVPADFVTGTGEDAENHVFMGWAKTAGAAEVEDLGSATGDVTVYAVWKVTKDAYYTVTFDGNGHDVNLSAVRVKEGSTAASPIVGAPNGYKFDGWYLNSKCSGVKYDFASAVYKDITVYAKWTAISYDIVYITEGDVDNPNPASYTIEDEIILQDVHKEGFTFLGWYKDAAYSETVKKIPAGSAGDKSLYARWKPETYTIRYVEGSDGVILNNDDLDKLLQVKKYKESVTLLGKTFKKIIYERDAEGNLIRYDSDGKVTSNGSGAPKVDHYVDQVGWSRIDGGKKDFDFGAEYNVDSSITLYPLWDSEALNRNPIKYMVISNDGKTLVATDFIATKYIGVESVQYVKHRIPTTLTNDKYEITAVASTPDVGVSLDNPSFEMPANEVTITLTVSPKKKDFVVKFGDGADQTIKVSLPVTNTEAEDSVAINKAVKDAHNENSDVTVPEKDASGFEFNGHWVDSDGDGIFEPVYDKMPDGGKIIEVDVGDTTIKVVVGENDNEDIVSEKINGAVEAAKNDGVVTDVPAKGDKDETGHEFNGKWEDSDGDGTFEPVYETPTGSHEIEVVVGSAIIDVVVKDNSSAEEISKIIDKVVTEKAGTDPSVVLPTKDESGYEYGGNWKENSEGKYEPVYDKFPADSKVIEVTVNAETTIKVVVKESDTPDKVDEKINVAVAAEKAENSSLEIPVKGVANDDEKVFDGHWAETGTGKYEPSYEDVPADSKVVKVVLGADTVKVVVKNDDSVDQIDEKINDAVNALKLNDPTLDVPVKGGKDGAGYAFEGHWKENGSGQFEPAYEKVVEAVVGDKTVDVTIEKGDSESDVNKKINEAVTDAATKDPSLDTPAGTVDKTGHEFDGKWEDPDGDGKFTPVYDGVPDDSKEIVVVVGKDSVVVVVKKDDSSDNVNDKINDAVADAAAKDPTVVLPSKDEDENGYAFDDHWKETEPGKYEPAYEKVVEAVVGDKTVDVTIEKGDSESDVNKKINDAVADAATKDPSVVLPGKDEDENGYAFDDHWKETEPGKYEPAYEKVVEAVVGDKTVDVTIEKGDSESDVNKKITEAVTDAAAKDPSLDTPAGTADKTGHEFDGKWEDPDGDGKFTPVYDGVPDDSKEIIVEVGKDSVVVVVKKDDSSDNVNDKINEAVADAATKNPTVVLPSKDEDENGYAFDDRWKETEPGKYEPAYEKVVEAVVGDRTVDVIIEKDDKDVDVSQKINDAVAEAVSRDPSIEVPVVGEMVDKGNAFTGSWEKNESGEYEPVMARAYRITYVMPKSAKLSASVNVYFRGVATALPSAYIEGDSSWKFMGWFEDERMFGTRVRSIGSSEKGRKTFYALFQKTVKFKAGDVTGEMTIVYTEGDENDAIETALKGVIPAGYAYGGTWDVEDGIYTLGLIRSTAVPQFKISVCGRAVNIAGAKIGSKVVVSDGLGRVVMQGRISLVDQRVELPSAGNYIVRVAETARRVMVR